MFLVGEVEIEGALRQSRPADHLLDSCPVVAPFREHARGGVDQFTSRGSRDAFVPARAAATSPSCALRHRSSIIDVYVYYWWWTMGRRWESLSGVAGLAFVFVALFLPGPPPKTDDTTAVLTATLVDHRTAFVYGMLLAALGLMALLWFFGVLGARLASLERRTSPSAIAAVAGGLIGIALMFVGMLLFAGAAF